jgi:uncharacterized protein (DUF305 family)
MRPSSAVPIAAALFLALAGCTSDAASADAPAGPSAAASADAAFGGTDLAWIEINIALDDQVLPLLDLAPTRSADPALKSLAADLRTSVTADLATLHRLHDQAGLPSENPHEGMLMPGLVPADAVTRAAARSGPDFDTAMRAELRPYLEQSHRLANDEQKSGTDPATRALAATTAAARQAALRRLPA